MNKPPSIGQLLQDENNLNQGTEAGAQVLDRSLKEVGYARSLVMTADGVIICGNQTHKAALRRGDTDKKPIIIETDGDVPVIVKRKDVVSGTPTAIKIAAYDNLANQRGLSWRPDARIIVEQQGVKVEEIGWTPVEVPIQENEPAISSGGERSIEPSYQIVVECQDEADQQRMYERLSGEGFKCRVLTI